MIYISYLGVVTSTEHEQTLRKIFKDTKNTYWYVGEENPNLEDILGNFEKQAAQLVIVDELGLPYFESLSASELIKHATRYKGSSMRIIFIASPQRTKNDPYLHELIESGITGILCLRYYDGDLDKFTTDLSSLIENPINQTTALTRLESLPEPEHKKGALSGIFSRNKPEEVRDCLISPFLNVDNEYQTEPTMSEAEWFKLHGVKIQDMQSNDQEEESVFDLPTFATNHSSQSTFSAPSPINPGFEQTPTPNTTQLQGFPKQYTHDFNDPSKLDYKPPISSFHSQSTQDDTDEVNANIENGHTKPSQNNLNNCKSGLHISDITENELNELADRVAERIAQRDHDKAVAEREAREKEKRAKRRETYAIAGIAHNIGVTHFTITASIALALSNPNKKVVCLITNKREFNDLTLNPLFRKKEGTFTLNGAEFRFLGKDAWPDDADIVLCDCGLYDSDEDAHVKTMYATAKHKILVIGGTSYKNQFDLIRITQAMPENVMKSLTWARFGASDEFINFFNEIAKSKNTEIVIHGIPYDDSFLSLQRNSPNFNRIIQILRNNRNTSNPKQGNKNNKPIGQASRSSNTSSQAQRNIGNQEKGSSNASN